MRTTEEILKTEAQNDIHQWQSELAFFQRLYESRCFDNNDFKELILETIQNIEMNLKEAKEYYVNRFESQASESLSRSNGTKSSDPW